MGNCHQHATCYYTSPGQVSTHSSMGNCHQHATCYYTSPGQVSTHPSMGNCHQHATCYYTSPGQNTCACNEGYIGDGYDCSLTNSCTGVCHPQATCEDIEGVPHCICGNGYHGDGIVCYSNIAIEIASNSILINFNNLLMIIGVRSVKTCGF
ncbi:stabilin-2-like [Anneissia japonica]|uniref:stabilin-2-like n=1 Tax=Anneissia japonica TaxID=1529436 RepID=UPI0014257DD1|nr:stabilin-2-like [Anneissia japonica]